MCRYAGQFWQDACNLGIRQMLQDLPQRYDIPVGKTLFHRVQDSELKLRVITMDPDVLLDIFFEMSQAT
jgi:hypothetical protein